MPPKRRNPAEVTFTTIEEAVSIACPPGLGSLEVWHKDNAYFGFRVDAPRKRDGVSNRVWTARFKEGRKHTKRTLGRVSRMTYDEALYQALTLRRIGAARADDVVVPTLKESYDSYCLVRVRKKWSQSTIDNYAKDILWAKDWWHRRIDSFTPQDMNNRYKQILARVSKSPKAKKAGYDGQATAVSVMRLMRAIFNDAIELHVIQFNPTATRVDHLRLVTRPV